MNPDEMVKLESMVRKPAPTDLVHVFTRQTLKALARINFWCTILILEEELKGERHGI
jgi:hypothetical protein